MSLRTWRNMNEVGKRHLKVEWIIIMEFPKHCWVGYWIKNSGWTGPAVGTRQTSRFGPPTTSKAAASRVICSSWSWDKLKWGNLFRWYVIPPHVIPLLSLSLSIPSLIFLSSWDSIPLSECVQRSWSECRSLSPVARLTGSATSDNVPCSGNVWVWTSFSPFGTFGFRFAWKR